MRNYPTTILSADNSKNATGSAFFVGQAVSASFVTQNGDTGAAGTVKIQGSNEAPVGDPLAYTPTAASFADITNATSAISSGVGPAIIIANMPFQYIRAVYTRTSGGTSTITVKMSALGV